jgi:hypothetical protein
MRTNFIAARLVILALVFHCSVRSGHSSAAPGNSEASSFVLKSRVYDVLPVAQRGGSEISLDGQWDLAQATQELASEAVDVAGLKWQQVQMPATIQYALFQAKAISPNPQASREVSILCS